MESRDERNPALALLDVLVGRWSVRPKVPGLGAAWTEFSWQEDGQFLKQFSDVDGIPDDAPEEWKQNAPFPTVNYFGLDDASNHFTSLYADGRGVRRVYQMTFDGHEWRMWREAPGFNQRFTGIFNATGDAITAQWEFSEDGENWRLDFELEYRKES